MNPIPHGVSSGSYKAVGVCARGGTTWSLVAAPRVSALLQAQLFDDPPGHLANRLKSHRADPFSSLLHRGRREHLQKPFAPVEIVGTFRGRPCAA